MKRKKETNSGTSFTPERTGSEEGKMDVDDENYIIVEQSPTLIPNVATFEDFKIDLNQSSPRNQDSLQQEQHDEDEKKEELVDTEQSNENIQESINIIIDSPTPTD